MARENVPAIASICKDAFNKVIAIKAVKENLDNIGLVLGQITDHRRGLFTIQERKVVESSFRDFSSDVNGMLDNKFREFGTVLDDCIKRESRGNSPFT